jgi:hypothetical protein
MNTRCMEIDAMRIFEVISLMVLLALPSQASLAVGLPQAAGVTVTLGGWVVAKFPSGQAPSSFAPGKYYLTVRFADQLPAIFSIEIGGTAEARPRGLTVLQRIENLQLQLNELRQQLRTAS